MEKKSSFFSFIAPTIYGKIKISERFCSFGRPGGFPGCVKSHAIRSPFASG